MKNKVFPGNIELLNMGNRMNYNLIITEKCRGEVWYFTDVSVQPCYE